MPLATSLCCSATCCALAACPLLCGSALFRPGAALLMVPPFACCSALILISSWSARRRGLLSLVWVYVLSLTRPAARSPCLHGPCACWKMTMVAVKASARTAQNVLYNDPYLEVARPARKTSAPRSACLFDDGAIWRRRADGRFPRCSMARRPPHRRHICD